MAVWRRRPLGTGRLCDFPTIEEILALLDEGLDDGLVEFGGGQCVLVLKIGPHERGPETNGQIVSRHQRGLTLLTYPVEVSDDIFENVIVHRRKFPHYFLQHLQSLIMIYNF